MIEVIGKDQKHIKECSCRNCASVLRYTDNDTVTRRVTDYSGSSDDEKTVQCPTCGYKIHVS